MVDQREQQQQQHQHHKEQPASASASGAGHGHGRGRGRPRNQWYNHRGGGGTWRERRPASHADQEDGHQQRHAQSDHGNQQEPQPVHQPGHQPSQHAHRHPGHQPGHQQGPVHQAHHQPGQRYQPGHQVHHQQNHLEVNQLAHHGQVQGYHVVNHVQGKLNDVTLEEGAVDAAPALVYDLQRKLATSDIECMICYDPVGRRSSIWSCGGCYSIFHLSCIKKWARAPTSVDRASSAASAAGGENWRCPGCQSVQHSPADVLRYACFCGQVLDPPVDLYLTPHSCGEPCRKPLDKLGTGFCKHLCTLQCHPGPCPPCVAFASPETCGCGRTTVTRRCMERDSTITSCGQQCQRMLSCGRHRCNRQCHEDDCGPCDAVVLARCFCQRKKEKLRCELIPVKGEIDKDAGVYSCEAPCSKVLSCGNHSCKEKCHPGSCGTCESSPSMVTTCYCGKRPLKKFPVERTSCTDPIPTCNGTCEKLMPCNKHRCNVRCHPGACPPCEALEEQRCRCGSSSRIVPCHLGAQEFVCDKKCGRKKNCGRHRCNSTCCDNNDGHLCMLECGKKLRCGQHTCQELCHAGHCPPCLMSAFTELSCACGKNSIPPPVPCGTPVPQCDSPCSVPRPCGHPATHICHLGPCPPCKYPVTKECVGNHVQMRNVPCGTENIRCNLPCGRIRRCGRHTCSRSCHSDSCDIGQDSRSLSCGQVCGAPRRECSHNCVAPCHPTALCPDTRCNTAVEITCGCKRLAAKVPCDVGGGGRDPLTEARIMNSLPTPLQPVETTERMPLSKRRLSCNDECAKAEKLKALADALGIAPSPISGQAAEGLSDVLQETLRRDYQFVSDVEDRFKYLISGPKTIAGVGGMRAHAFGFLPKDKREVIHQLAQRWFLSVNSVGWDPKRYMVVHVTAKSKIPPLRLTKPTLVQPRFNPSLDLDPRLVVALYNLPREADVTSLVLRFGGECELIWLNDRNALAIFGDVTRAATAMRRVDHASAYPSAVIMATPAAVASPAPWGPSSSSSSPHSSTRNRSQRSSDPAWVEDDWVDEVKGSLHNPKAATVNVSNPWSALRSYPGESSSSNFVLNLSNAAEEAVDDWEKAADQE